MYIKIFSILMLCSILSTWTIAGPGEGVRLSSDTTISPMVEASYSYDSNVYLDSEDELDDFYFDFIAAVTLLKQNNKNSLSLRAWYQLRRYDEYIEKDDDTFQENFDWVYGTRRELQITLNQRYGKVADYEFTQPDVHARNQEGKAALRLLETRTRRVERELKDLGLSVAHDTDKLESNLGVNYTSVEFDAETELHDWSEAQAGVNFGFRATDKSFATLVALLGQHESDNDSGDALFLKGRIGFRTIPTYKTSIDISLGLEQYDADAAQNQDLSQGLSEGDDLDETVFHYDLTAVWAVTEKLDFQVYGRNEILPTSAFERNTKQVNQGSVGLLFRLTETVHTTLGVSYRSDDYKRPIDDVDAFEELVGAQLRLMYQNKRKFLQLYAKIRYEEFESNIQDEYAQLRATIGLNLKY